VVIASGATKLREDFAGEVLDGVLHAYAGGIRTAFAIALAACCLCVIFGLLLSTIDRANINAKESELEVKCEKATEA
jgi:hypothetical protein